MKKITPYKDLSWYVKWISSVILLCAMVLTTKQITPINLYFHTVGVTGWLVVGYLWHDRALIFINSVALAIFLSGIIYEG
jgi:hypothetical protein|tara:strand:- start:879 stop:1118 length:240 start_codon:yes stop_codon:yes gene_type:complete